MGKADFARYEEIRNSLEFFLSEVPKRCETIVVAGQYLADVLEDDPKVCKMNNILQQCAINILHQLETIKEVQAALYTERPVAPPLNFEW